MNPPHGCSVTTLPLTLFQAVALQVLHRALIGGVNQHRHERLTALHVDTRGRGTRPTYSGKS